MFIRGSTWQDGNKKWNFIVKPPLFSHPSHTLSEAATVIDKSNLGENCTTLIQLSYYPHENCYPDKHDHIQVSSTEKTRGH